MPKNATACRLDIILEERTPPTRTVRIVENQRLGNREMGPSTTNRTGTHNGDEMHDEDQAKILDTLTPK